MIKKRSLKHLLTLEGAWAALVSNRHQPLAGQERPCAAPLAHCAAMKPPRAQATRQGDRPIAPGRTGIGARNDASYDARTKSRSWAGTWQNRDPLGRPVRTTGPDFGDTTKVPTEIETQRAREILRELQQRLGDRDRPLLELDYIERLLRRF